MTQGIKADIEAYWDRRPCNIQHSDLAVGSLSYSRGVTLRKLAVEPHIPRFSMFGTWQGKTVLDLGCGIGTQALLFALNGAKVVAIDISSKSLEIARARALTEGLDKQIQFWQADIEVPRDWAAQIGCQYDLVYSFGVLHHTPDPEWALAKLHPYLKRNAELRIMVYHRWAWKWLWVFLRYGRLRFWRWKKLIAECSEAQTGCPYTETYTRYDILMLLKKAGYEVTDMRVEHIFPYVVSEYKRGRLVKTWYWKLVPPWLFRWLERHFGLHLLVHAVPSKGVPT